MKIKQIGEDLVGVWFLLTACLIIGLIVNETRPQPLSLVYASPQDRLQKSVEQLSSVVAATVVMDGDIERDELQKISLNHLTLILDARPEIFYRLGHIPSSLSLPRDDFENRYQALQTTLMPYHDKPVIVYCSSSECHDSQMVAEALQKLGYQHVRLFRGGWSEWENASLPEEKE